MMDQIMTMRIFLSHLSNFVCFFVTSVGNGENVFMLWMSSSFGCRRARLTFGCMSLRDSGYRSNAGKTFWRLLPGPVIGGQVSVQSSSNQYSGMGRNDTFFLTKRQE